MKIPSRGTCKYEILKVLFGIGGTSSESEMSVHLMGSGKKFGDSTIIRSMRELHVEGLIDATEKNKDLHFRLSPFSARYFDKFDEFGEPLPEKNNLATLRVHKPFSALKTTSLPSASGLREGSNEFRKIESKHT